MKYKVIKSFKALLKPNLIYPSYLREGDLLEVEKDIDQDFAEQYKKLGFLSKDRDKNKKSKQKINIEE